MKKLDQTIILNFYIKLLAIINVYYCVIPHFTGQLMNINHIFISIVVFVFFILINLTSRKISKNVFSFILLPLFAAFFILLRASSNVFSYYNKWIEFTVSVFLYATILRKKYEVNSSTYNMVFFSSLVIVIFYIIEAFSLEFYTYTNSGIRLVLTCGNQNSAAMQLLLVGQVFFIFSKKFSLERKKGLFLISSVAILFIIYMILLTGSRSTLIGLMFVLLFWFFPKLKNILTNRLISFVIVFPLLFALFFVCLYSSGHSEIVLFGRNIFNGREKMWLSVFEQPINNWLLGSYHEYTVIGEPPFQLHNGLVDMIASYGLIITSAFLLKIKNWLCKIAKSDDNYSYMIVVCILSLIIESSGEAAMFIGGRCTFLAMLLFFSSVEQSYAKE